MLVFEIKGIMCGTGYGDGPRPLKSTGRHGHFLNSTGRHWLKKYSDMGQWHFKNSTGDRGTSDRDVRHWHFLKSTCDIRTPSQGPQGGGGACNYCKFSCVTMFSLARAQSQSHSRKDPIKNDMSSLLQRAAPRATVWF